MSATNPLPTCAATLDPIGTPCPALTNKLAHECVAPAGHPITPMTPHVCACQTTWTDLPIDTSAAVARFQAISDRAGNPGTLAPCGWYTGDIHTAASHDTCGKPSTGRVWNTGAASGEHRDLCDQHHAEALRNGFSATPTGTGRGDLAELDRALRTAQAGIEAAMDAARALVWQFQASAPGSVPEQRSPGLDSPTGTEGPDEAHTATQDPVAHWLANGARVVHATLGPGTIAANAWAPDEGYTARVEFDNPNTGPGWVSAETLTPIPIDPTPTTESH